MSLSKAFLKAAKSELINLLDEIRKSDLKLKPKPGDYHYYQVLDNNDIRIPRDVFIDIYEDYLDVILDYVPSDIGWVVVVMNYDKKKESRRARWNRKQEARELKWIRDAKIAVSQLFDKIKETGLPMISGDYTYYYIYDDGSVGMSREVFGGIYSKYKDMMYAYSYENYYWIIVYPRFKHAKDMKEIKKIVKEALRKGRNLHTMG